MLPLQAWCATTLTLLAEARRAHGGDKVFCAAVGANGVLFTGGDDKVRRYDLLFRARGSGPNALTPRPLTPPLQPSTPFALISSTPHNFPALLCGLWP